MKKLVTISRQYGSGGRIIGKLVAEKLNVPLYDKEIIDMAAQESGLSREIVESAELRAKNSFSYGLSSAMSFGEGMSYEPTSINEKTFLAQYKIIEEIGKTNEGVIVGRCADFVLRDIPGVTNIFIHGEMKDRVKRAHEIYGEEKAEEMIAVYDKARHNYYNYHTSLKWGDYKNYNLSLNSSYISEEEAANLIVEYISKRTY